MEAAACLARSGVEVKGKPSVGVAYLPAMDEIVTAATGMGCRWNGKPLTVLPANTGFLVLIFQKNFLS